MRLLRFKANKEISDLELMEGIQMGNESFLELLYDRCRTSIQHFVINNQGSQDEAEDIVQDTIIVAWEKIIRKELVLNQHTKLSTYLMGVAKFKWYAALRAKGKMAPIETDYDEPEEENLEEEKFILLSELINKLDDICREILTQKYWLKKKFEEIKIQAVPTTAALKMKSSRCHVKLKELHEAN